MDQFWQPGPVEPRLIVALNNQGDRADSFVVKDHQIFAINSNHQLWSYDLITDSFTVLGSVREETDFLTDVSENQLLLSIQVAAKKEVVELTVNN